MACPVHRFDRPTPLSSALPPPLSANVHTRAAPNPPDTPMPPPEPPTYPPPPPPVVPVTLTGTVEVYTSHLHNSPNRTAPYMSYAVTFANESTGYSLKASFSLGSLANTADVQTGDRVSGGRDGG